MRKFSGEHDTFLTKRFDRTQKGEHVHFASAMTLLGKKDCDNCDMGVSYLDLAEFITRYGGKVNEDLEELWRRIVFYICVSNTDDHLRNHGFILTPSGSQLSPAYDMNSVARGGGLSLNITREDNRLDLDLAREVAPFYRLEAEQANAIIVEVKKAVQQWQSVTAKLSPFPRVRLT